MTSRASDPFPPLAENLQLLSGVFPGAYIVLAQPRQGERGLDQYHQADLCLGPVQPTTMQTAEIAMFFRVAKTTFDHRSAKSVRRLGLRRLHPLLVCLDDLFPFQSLDGSTLLRVADATLTHHPAPGCDVYDAGGFAGARPPLTTDSVVDG